MDIIVVDQAPTAHMRAARVHVAGGPDNLRVESITRPDVTGEALLIRVHAAGVNRSDTLACRGVLPGPFPRVLGRDFAGEVVAGPTPWLGRRVWGAGGGDIGLVRDGSHAEFLVAPTSAVTEMPATLDFCQAAASALAYFTAVHAWKRAAPPSAGAPVVVSGAVGGVGGAAAYLARRDGARVIGIVRPQEEPLAAADPAIDHWIASDRDDIADAIRDHTAGDGAISAVDTVGGSLLGQILAGMAVNGGICVLSTPPTDAVASVDALDFYRRELRLTGLHTGRLTAEDGAHALASLRPDFEAGTLRPTRMHRSYPLDQVATAYHDVERGVDGRAVLTPFATDTV